MSFMSSRLNRWTLALASALVLPITAGSACEKAATKGDDSVVETASPGPASAPATHAANDDGHGHAFKVHHTKKEWQERLTAQQFHVLREKGTERPFTGAYWDNKKEGTYVCAGCNQPLYASKDKFKSGTGWPSFTRPIDEKAIVTESDTAFGMVRTELMCSRCGGHLGHVFDDGPAPTGKRHCINSASLLFKPAHEGEG